MTTPVAEAIRTPVEPHPAGATVGGPWDDGHMRATVSPSLVGRDADLDALRDAYAEWDTEKRFSLPGIRVTDPKAAQCGEVLKGVLKPHQCKLFGKECTPESPVGALMVSSEGACAAYHNYVHRKTEAAAAVA